MGRAFVAGPPAVWASTNDVVLGSRRRRVTRASGVTSRWLPVTAACAAGALPGLDRRRAHRGRSGGAARTPLTPRPCHRVRPSACINSRYAISDSGTPSISRRAVRSAPGISVPPRYRHVSAGAVALPQRWAYRPHRESDHRRAPVYPEPSPRPLRTWRRCATIVPRRRSVRRARPSDLTARPDRASAHPPIEERNGAPPRPRRQGRGLRGDTQYGAWPRQGRPFSQTPYRF
jgi:hypothetical protein